ncbi:hypothetical protein HMF7854_14425 [Sphingomonas ginkgonis]|uniref:Uncharacterized protein n=1 Tax=Sphingomonas ginkgonis TaxID=2315330 RepID=A0A3R9WU77_9SPHN|nr:hypothetical protein [Sphingomonas ginkgonis]RST31902.1 hypothetical protein HMF7854_14425 [Sphingomonas ginkgonis]
MIIHKYLAGGVAAALFSTAVAAQVPVAAAPAVPIMVQQPSAVGSGSLLPSNSDVWLTLDSEMNSKHVKQGDTISLKVARDVMLGNYVVIPRGTPATGHISMRSGKGVFGKSAKLEFDLDAVNLNGRTIPLAGHHRVAGDGNTGATVGAVVAAGVIGGLFVTGHSAIAAQGSEWKALTKEPIAIEVASAPAPAAVAPQAAAVIEAAAPATAPAPAQR